MLVREKHAIIIENKPMKKLFSIAAICFLFLSGIFLLPSPAQPSLENPTISSGGMEKE